MLKEINKTSVPDEFIRRYILPKRIVWQSQGDAAPLRSDTLLDEQIQQAATQDSPGCLLKHSNGSGGILLDFGCELNGGIKITINETFNHRPVHLRIRFGESVSEAMGQPCNDHSMQDSIVQVARLSTTDFGNTGFRFVRIDTVDDNTFVEIKHICAVLVFRDLEYKGNFECSDPRLNKIWQVGAYTVHLNMQEYLWDGIKRDRLVWLGDMHPEVMAINYAFGFNEIVPRSLDFIRDRAPLPAWINGIPSYSLWWILVHKDWYLYHGDIEYLNAQRSYLFSLLEHLQQYISLGNFEILPEPRFLDWPTSEDKSALNAGLQSLMVMAFKAGAWICKHLQESSAERRCLETVERLITVDPVMTQRKQAVALMSLTGILDPEKANANSFNENPCEGLSPFLGYYVLQARSLANDHKGALDVIREYWGAMLDLGATTFWEDFDISWKDNCGRIDQIVPDGKRDFHAEYGKYCYKGLRHSLCHGWSSGPTAWLSEHILGFRPLEPGSKKLLIKPELVDLDWAKGTFPTPYGPVTVNHSKDKHGQIQTILKKPKDIEVVKHEHIKNHRMETIVS